MPKTILVVEDDIDNSFIIQTILQLSGHQVHLRATLDSMEAIALNVDIVILDQWLRQSLGTELCKQFKANPFTNAIPVIICSAVPHLEALCKSINADAFIPKPFDLEDFEKVINQCLAARSLTIIKPGAGIAI